jgi:hypothetical protein
MVEEQKTDNFLFGDVFGGLMQRTSMQFQMRSMMAGLFMVMLGLVITCVYIIGWTNFSTFFKVMTGINTFFGVLILYSNLVGAFQAYKTLLQAQSFQESITQTFGNNSDNLKGGLEIR